MTLEDGTDRLHRKFGSLLPFLSWVKFQKNVDLEFPTVDGLHTNTIEQRRPETAGDGWNLYRNAAIMAAENFIHVWCIISLFKELYNTTLVPTSQVS